MSNDPAVATSVDKALALLVLLNEREQLRVSDAAAALGVARSTAHRLLNQLRAREFAVQDDQRGYRPGPALRALRSGQHPLPDLRRLHRHLGDLSTRVAETVHLVVLEDTEVRFVDGVEGPQVLRVGLRTGAAMPAHRTSGGKALLAALPPASLHARYPAGVPAELAGQLAQIRRRGYAVNDNETEKGITAIGAAVVDPAGRTVAAIAVAAPSARCSRARLAELAPALLDTAYTAGREL
ncbi:IclR family transcriptional regulator [Actinophytocola sediminis]